MYDFYFKQKAAYEMGWRLVGSEICIRDRLSSYSGFLKTVQHQWQPYNPFLPP